MNPRALAAAGVALWFLLALQFVVLWIVWREQALAMAVAVPAELLTGREGGLPAALAAGYHPLLAWQTSAVQDLGTAFLGYPIFLHLLHKHEGSDRYLMRRIRRIEAKAAKHEAYVDRWGPLGLSLFMLVPFLVNGPFIALVLGRLAGIRTHHLLVPVIVTTFLVAAAWTFFLDSMLALLGAFHPNIGWWAAGIAAGIVTLLGIVDFWREHRAMQTEA